MPTLTPQERLALTVLAILIMLGAVARHGMHRAETTSRLDFTAEADDTLHAGLRGRVEEELARERIRRQPLAPGERLDPNDASAAELARLPRIGPALAERIVAHRTREGPFRSVQDLRGVPGIGESVLAGIGPHLALPAVAPAGMGGHSPLDRVDINRATEVELQALPGIGPALAERIVAYRRAHGPFRTFDDLENVSGVGPRLRERLERAARLGS